MTIQGFNPAQVNISKNDLQTKKNTEKTEKQVEKQPKVNLVPSQEGKCSFHLKFFYERVLYFSFSSGFPESAVKLIQSVKGNSGGKFWRNPLKSNFSPSWNNLNGVNQIKVNDKTFMSFH